MLYYAANESCWWKRNRPVDTMNNEKDKKNAEFKLRVRLVCFIYKSLFWQCNSRAVDMTFFAHFRTVRNRRNEKQKSFSYAILEEKNENTYDHHMVDETAASIMFAGKKGSASEWAIWDFDVWSGEQMMTLQNAWKYIENRLKIDAVQQLIFTPLRYFCVTIVTIEHFSPKINITREHSHHYNHTQHTLDEGEIYGR